MNSREALPIGDRWHVLAVAGAVTGCGRDVANYPLSARARARDVDVEQRCDAVGCRRLWPANLRLVG